MPTLSGQTTVTTAGTAVKLAADQLVNGPVMVKALTTNTGPVYLGNVDGDVSSANGLPLSAGEAQVLTYVGNLSSLWVDSAVNGEGVAWLALEY